MSQPPAPSPDSLYRDSAEPEGGAVVPTSPGDIYGSPSYGTPLDQQQTTPNPVAHYPREDAYGSPGVAIDLSRDMYTQDDIALAPSMNSSPSPDRAAGVWATTPDNSPLKGEVAPTEAAAVAVDNAPLLFELLSRHATQFKDKKVFQFCDDGITPSRTLTYGELESRTRALALELLSRPGPPGTTPPGPLLKRGDRAMLVFLPSLDFILAFIACLRAGITPVPCYPPDPRNLRVNVSLFAAVCASCGAKVALTHAAYSSVVSLASMKETALKWLGLGGGSKGGAAGTAVWPEHLAWWDVEEATKSGGKGVGGAGTPAGAALAATLDTSLRTDLAFLQYTSGSTSEPKGVRITHGNLAHNLRVITTSLGAGPQTVVASWLPQYHDMGLIGSYLGVVACGGGGVYMSPLTFLKNPLAWITAMSKYKATHVQAPNFAYALTARRWRDLPPKEKAAMGAATLNLSSLRHAFNAAEAVTTGAIADFCAAFAPHGLSPKAFSPGYGLAENTVYVSDGGRTVVWVDREALEEEGRVVVHATAPITALTSPAAVAAFEGAAAAKAAALTAATVATAAAAAATAAVAAAAATAAAVGSGGSAPPHVPALISPTPTPRRIGSFVSCGPVSAPPGIAPPNPSASEGSASGSGSGKNHDVWVLIVDPNTSMPTRSEGMVGEVWVHSPSTAAGYEGKEDATRAAFKAHLAASFPALPPSSSTTSSAEVSPMRPGGVVVGSSTPAAPPSPPRRTPPTASTASPILAGLTNALRVPWLRTGDLGFIWHGELYICARVKDLIIIRGRNFYPHDIEEALEEIMAGAAGGPGVSSFLRPGATAAFTLPMADFVAAAAAAAASAGGGASASAAAAAAAAAAGSSNGDGADEGLVIVGEVRDGVKESAFPGLVSELKIVCSRDFGIRPTAVLLLKARGTRKTTSGKVARKHNATAYGARMRGGPAGEKNPWGVGNTVVLYEWRSSAGGADVTAAKPLPAAAAPPATPARASSASASGTGISSAATPNAAAAAASAQGAPPPTPARPLKDYRSLTGAALLGQLQRDVGEMMNESAWATLPTTTSLFELGLDSLSLAQLPPRFKAEYGFNIGDAQVFSEAFTLGWLVENAGALRVGGVALPEAAAGAGVGAGGEGGEGGEGGSENSGGGGAAGAGAAAATAAVATAAAAATAAGSRPPGTPARGGEGGGLSPTTPGGAATQRTPAKKRPNQPSVVEANCPCCLMCIG